MPTIGAGVWELRIRDENNANVVRCFYVTKFENAIFLLHCFVKKTQKTPASNIVLGKMRYKQLVKGETQ